MGKKGIPEALVRCDESALGSKDKSQSCGGA